MLYSAVLISLAAMLAAVNADGMYTKKSPVLQVDAKSYDSLIARSNHTSIVEFYAPWCGHCQNLKPAYEKAAKTLAGLAKVAAVNCDDDSNKPFCGSMGVQGFPTLKIVRPSAKSGKPAVEDYQGPRTAKAIVDTVVDKIPNHVKKVNDKNLDEWLAEGNDTAKAILFTEKGTTSALLRALAVDFLSSVPIAQIRNKETKAVQTFGITSFPTLVLLPGGDKDALVYDGEMKKEALVSFLRQVAEPNPDPAPKAAKASKKNGASSSSASSKFAKASASHQSAEASSGAASATKLKVEDSEPLESPDPFVPREDQPVQLPITVAALPELSTSEDLAKACLGEKTGTCALVLLPPGSKPDESLSDAAKAALSSLTELVGQYAKRKDHIFPVYSVPGNNEGAVALRKGLGLPETDVKIVVVNAKRGWWRPYNSGSFGISGLRDWVDAIRLGDGEKHKLTDGLIHPETPVEEPRPEEAEKPQQEVEHDEL